ncbi:WbqC family protein [Mucilaginibacter sp. L3T2-6]|uniref:WbqC family protein n=1 Tax=Mucilaginibacter sp. L3T2-6 TaxID=3062491 RepID=UPI002675FDB3|nr:WbqC family protein [Mucilaginibacter sp. L3T2-6]MDO3643098.1 WbqC family protein [Mucilaginibacter sp. L3T2-6]MDV6215865.1 WbqC family protein [Mucilaginibacter sp. L3T2-6]
MIEKGAVFPMFYLAPIEYFTKLVACKEGVLIEKEEHFPKQTYRNRAHIYTPDGLLAITVPVMKGSKNHTKIKDVKISYDFRWQQIQWSTLQTCYRRSAYFEFYEDEIIKFYENRFDYLFDYNEQYLHFLLKAMKLKIDYEYTQSYQPDYPGVADYRHNINPKLESSFKNKPYFQVFEDRHGFINNLSIIDLLFNQGPHSVNYL